MLNKLSKLPMMIKRILSTDQKSISEYIDLEMNKMGHKYALQCTSGALVSLIKINGIGVVSEKEEKHKVQRALFGLINQFFLSKDAPIVSVMYAQTSGTVGTELDAGLNPSRQAAHRLGMDADAIIDDIVSSNEPLCHTEEIYLAVWTLPKFNKEFKKKKEVTVRTGEDKLSSFFRDNLREGANPITTNTVTLKQHNVDLKTVKNRLTEGGLLHQFLEQLDALQWMKFKLNDGKVSRHEPFELFNHNDSPVRYRGGKVKFDLNTGTTAHSAIFLPPLSEQLPESIFIPSEDDADGILYSNGRYHACCEITTSPGTVADFNNLRKNTIGIDFRMTFIMSEVDTSGYQSLNQSVNNFFRANYQCKKAYDEIQFQKYMKTEEDASDVNLQILVVISADDRSTLMTHRKQMNDAVVDWGRAEISLDLNDPMQTFVSSIPGLNYRSFHLGCWISSDRLVRILPLDRPATFWDYGLICFRTVDGKPFFFQPHSNLQHYHLSLYIAPPRQGKSLLMNAQGIASILGDGVSQLGLMVILDIGPTSRGALQLLRYMMVKRYSRSSQTKSIQQIRDFKAYTEKLIIEHKWSPLTDGWFINPLETRLGFNVPTEDEKSFMLNFYLTNCTKPESGEPLDGTSKLLEELISEVFQNNISRNEMKMFNGTIDKELTKIAREKLGIEPNDVSKQISLFQLRDMLFQRNLTDAAIKAHRLAMPTVSNMVQTLTNSPSIRDGHPKELINAVKNMLNTHIQKMPYLSKASTIDFETAKIISFDMKPVSESKSNQGKLDTFAQYLLAMHVGMKKFRTAEELVKRAPPLYREYWKNQFFEVSRLKKCLSLDEWHTLSVKATDNDGNEYSKSQAGAEYIDYLIREAPKWNLSINIASHRVADFTDTMKSMSTNRFFFAGLEEKEIKSVRTQMSLTDSEYKLLVDGIHGPQPGVGNELLFIFRARNVSGSGGREKFSARLKFLCSGMLMWALSTDKEDMPHKFHLEQEHPEKEWLEALYKAFPSGSMSEIREQIRKEMREQLDSSQEVEGRTNDIEEHLYSEVIKHLGANPHIKSITREILSRKTPEMCE
ncbi:hypothetical protein [Vibrio sp. YQ_11]|uniref:hypothetical protein n=1 Tax=Vibrio sp. YQ_11 TaxID=3367233 RepID=UPI00370A386D